MSLLVNQSDSSSCSFENVNETTQDPIEILPYELVLEVFSHLNLATLGTICCVNKTWNRLANTPILWKIAIYREIAFGNDKWAKYFGADVVKDEDNSEEFSSLPSNNFIADCKNFKSIFPERNAKDSLMLVRLPKTLNGGLTLKNLGKLAKKYFSCSDSGYRFILPVIIQELGDKSIDKSHWVLMTKDVLPGSRAKSYDEQKKIVADLAEKALIGYDVPETLESAVCILSQYFGSNIRLFSVRLFRVNPWTYTRCKDKVQGYQTIVGGFSPSGLSISNHCYHDFEYFGVAALRKF